MPAKSTTTRRASAYKAQRQQHPRTLQRQSTGKLGEGSTPKEIAERKRALQIQQDLEEINAKYAVDLDGASDPPAQRASDGGGEQSLMSDLSATLTASFKDSVRCAAGQKPLAQRRVLVDATFRERDELARALRELEQQRIALEGPAGWDRGRPGSGSGGRAARRASPAAGSLTDRPAFRDRPPWSADLPESPDEPARLRDGQRTRRDGVWHEALDPATGARYFFDGTTGRTSWTNPGTPPAPAQPRPAPNDSTALQLTAPRAAEVPEPRAAPRPQPPHRLASCRDLPDVQRSTAGRLARASPARHTRPGPSFAGFATAAAAGNPALAPRSAPPPDPLAPVPRDSLRHDPTLWAAAGGAAAATAISGGGAAAAAGLPLSQLEPRLTLQEANSRAPPPPPSRTNWTRLVPPSRTNRTRLTLQGLHRLDLTRLLDAPALRGDPPPSLPSPY